MTDSEHLLPTPTAHEADGGTMNPQRRRGANHAVTVADWVEHGLPLLATPNTMDTLTPRTGDALEKARHRGGEHSRRAGTGNLREDVAMLPTPTAFDESAERRTNRSHVPGSAHSTNLAWRVGEMQAGAFLPTPTSRDGKGRNQRNTPDCLPVAVEQAATGWGRFTPAIRRWEHIMGRPAPTPVQTSNALRKWMLKHADDPMLMDGHWPLDHMTGDDGHPRVDGPMRARVWRRFKAADRGESLGVTRFLAACRTYEPDSPIPVALQPIPQVFAWWRRASPDRVPVAANLAPRFVEWMMGLDDGWVTNPMIWRQVNGDSRNLQLRALGNGVVPRQAMAALDWCLDVRERLSASRGDA